MEATSAELPDAAAWLTPFRWATCIGLWIVVVVLLLAPHVDLPLRSIAPLVGAAAICRTSLLLALHRGRRAPTSLWGITWCVEAALLTGLLDITGGPFNPFIVLYVTYLWLASSTLPPTWATLVGVVSLVGFAWLVNDHAQAEIAEHHRLNDFPTHLFTMWISGAAIAELVAHYVGRAREALSHRQRQLDEARERALRSEHLVSLTTLAAGAAHELSTPLATIAVASRELQRHADRLANISDAAGALKDDARLIRSEVDRCQAILDGMSGRASDGNPAAGMLTARGFADLVLARLTEAQRQRLIVQIADDGATPSVDGNAMVQAVAALIKNAFDASDSNEAVTLTIKRRQNMVRVEVHDRGAGMSTDVLRRAGEPFYTTKDPGQGLGLGLFLTRAFAERCGGTLEFTTADGTIAILEVPLHTGTLRG